MPCGHVCGCAHEVSALALAEVVCQIHLASFANALVVSQKPTRLARMIARQ